MKAIYLPKQSPEQLQALEQLYQSTRDVRIKMRTQMILLAIEKHLTAAAIGQIVRESESTVRRWIKRYQAEGVEGLRDMPRPGAPAKVTPGYREVLLQAVRRRPRSLGQPYSMWTLQRLADYLAEQTGIRVEDETIRRNLKEAQIALSRPQHTISSPDPEYKLKKRRLKRHVTD